MGVAFVSRVAKNFQDYYINVITQRLGAQLYSDGIRHSLELPYSVFEDQRSGETLGKLQKVRTDVEKLIAAAINVLFTSLVGIIFVMIYAFSVHWLIAPAFFLTVPVPGVISSVLSRASRRFRRSSSRKRRRWPARRPNRSATSNWSRAWAWGRRKSSA